MVALPWGAGCDRVVIMDGLWGSRIAHLPVGSTGATPAAPESAIRERLHGRFTTGVA